MTKLYYALALVLLGIATAGRSSAILAGEGAKANVKEVLARITLTPEMAQSSRLEPTSGNPPIPFGTKTKIEAQTRQVEAEAIQEKDRDGKVFAEGLRFTCDPRFRNLFTVGGQPLNARQFSYTAGPISWQAGDGWPVYTTFCPNPGYHTSMYYPAARIHQIVPSIIGQNYFVGCLTSGVCASNNSGQIAFAVNDNQYPDNRGYFVVTIYGIVP